ncbi:MAG: LD-carboxypeptidase [Actinobacteria bacterium]|nr:MAG: LD-carboxypeptidase [Actinomycetota bacterium]
MKPLPDGGTIGVAALASPYDMRSELERGVEWWETRGYRVKLAPGIHDRDDYVAGDARSRAHDLHTLFADPEVDAVQALQGGFGSSEILPHLDFDLIAANPKPFVGYSDITSLHVPIRQRGGFPTFYGPGLVGVGDKETTGFTRDRLLAVLRDGAPRRRLPLAPAADARDAVGARHRQGDPLLRGHARAAVLRRRPADAAPPRRQAREDRRRRRRRHEQMRLRRPPSRGRRLARHEVDRGRARQAPAAARGARAVQAAARPRQAHRFHSARCPVYARRRRTNVDRGRVAVRKLRGRAK